MMICPRIIDVQKRAERNLEVWRSWLDRKLRSGPRHICSTPLHHRITSKIPCLLYVNINQDILLISLIAEVPRRHQYTSVVQPTFSSDSHAVCCTMHALG
jgi:hypothetical protein